MSSADLLFIMQTGFSHFVKTRLHDIRRFHAEVMELENPVVAEEVSMEPDSSRQSIVVKHMDENGSYHLYWIPFAYFDDVEGYIASNLETPTSLS